ncbi:MULTISPECIES: hypothetical protein [Bacillus]|uniref:hypothetical protein n=1 Tax=Bacillus TaxID=1386 RepID=UPI0001A19190|nr:hypothetical protein [Bacillus pseudomycoides]EEM13983.1 hypothetical protein bpmyx0001_51490 [Bacillus pseudomycoides DSM 12442]MED1599162.1 hypothetical protein [Bacillus pseudomycoides]MED4712615.1 hypothetical protein [Bacillus pseudomycoides]OOR48439.1 hypothetical protein BLX05_29470 [Bacillus pseudomycoides]PDY08429.1 hypothetical protein COO16_29700 [Bacillus pseudomycoides]
MRVAKLVVSTFVLTMMLSMFLLGHGQHAHAELNDCPEGAYHRMIAKGTAVVEDENTGDHLFTGTFFKCKNCGDWIVTSGYPQSRGSIGDYITEGKITGSWRESTSIEVDPDYVHYTKDTRLPGYRFYKF